jgi:hypothetical protein
LTSLIGREEPISLPPELPISIRPPSKREIVDAIKAMKNRKAAGSDNILPEVLKADPYAMADILYSSSIVPRHMAERVEKQASQLSSDYARVMRCAKVVYLTVLVQ